VRPLDKEGQGMTGTLLLEATKTPLRSSGAPGRWRALLIEADTMGSSGYYSTEVLRRDGPGVFKAGTHIYIDHATESESYERPERSFNDLAGALIEDAQYEDGPDGKGLFARVQFLPWAIERIEEQSKIMPVELSIKAAGVIEDTEAGRIVTSIVHAMSVDVVTRAGAGGRLIQMTEAAKPAAVQVANLNEADKKVMTDLGTGLATLNTTMTTFLDKLAESQKAKEKADEEKDNLTAGQIVAKLAESGLPAPSQKRLAESYVKGADLDKMIEDEKAYVTSITESAKPGKVTRGTDDKGQKPGTVETDDSKEGGDDEVKESLAAFGNLFG
jgi:hypothetical protein